MWNTCRECSAYSEWLRHVSTERVQDKTQQGMFEHPSSPMQEVGSKSV